MSIPGIRLRRLTWSFIVSFLPTCFLVPPAAAQEPASQPVEEITVTARKRAETLQDVPATVTVFTEDRIERSNINRAGEIALLTPGVSLVDAAEVGDTQVNIRGMNGARDAENSYALVIDGITLTNPAALNREYSNLQQIEVLKGPQGAIYGRNASAGAFIITTREPGEELEGQIQAGLAQDDTYTVNGHVGTRLTDWLRGGVQGEYYKTDGFYKNEFLGKDDVVDNNETWALTGRLIFDISEDTTVDTKLRYGEVDAGSIVFNSVFHIPALAELPPAFGGNPFFYEDVNDHDFRFYSNIEHTNDQEALEFSAKLDHELDFATLTAWTLYSDIDNELGADGTSAAFAFFATDPACLQTAGALGTNGANFPLNPPQFIGGNGFPAILDPNGSVLGAYTPTTCDGTQYQRRNQEDISFEVRLTSNGDGPLQWMGGLYYLNIDREVAVSTGVDRLNAPSYRGAKVKQTAYTLNPTNRTDQLVWDDFDTDVYSVFGSIAYDFTDTLTADLALRWDREERDVQSKVPPPGNAPGESGTAIFITPCADGRPIQPVNPGYCDPNNIAGNGKLKGNSEDFDKLQPKVSFNWAAFESTNIYGSWGVGFRSGGFNNSGSQATVENFINIPLLNAGGTQGLCDPGTPGCIESGRSRVGITDSYDEETSSAFELGFKSEFLDNAIRLEAAAYYTEVDDMQFFEFVVGPFGLLRVVENIDEVEIKGVEGSVTWDATEWLDLYLGANFLDTEIKKNKVRPDTEGNDSPYTPEYTANLGAYFDFPIGADLNLFTNVDVSAIGDTWFHVVQGQERPIGFELLTQPLGVFPAPGEYSIAERDAYVLTNIRGGIESERWTFALFVDNAFDEDYLEEVIPAPEFGGSFIHPGSERRFGGDVTYRF